MKYLITGHKGFIGQNLVKYLKNLGHEVVGFDFPGLTRNIPVSDEIDVLVHLAAEVDVRKSILEPRDFFIKNCVSTADALEAAKLSNAKFIFTSSCGAANSTNAYSASKLTGEALCKAYHNSYNVDISILRLANVYGPYSDHKTSVISKFIKSKIENKPIEVYGTGHQKRDFIYVDDVCKAIVDSPEFLNVATGHLTSINSLIEILNIKDVNYLPPVKGEIFHPETQRWDGCEVGIEEGLEKTLKWFANGY